MFLVLRQAGRRASIPGWGRDGLVIAAALSVWWADVAKARLCGINQKYTVVLVQS